MLLFCCKGKKQACVIRKKIKNIKAIITLFLIIGCNSGGKDPEKVFLSEMVN
ncbi:hypothetical protein Q7M_1301 (plasmid) [Borrelia crocidurae str. Achema]|uniref:Variable outer membrane protein n=1 Tax=Borrelia crocidurae (strain Achema) TaxID=1155096 RepID=I0FF01_BORCA|nr:hypothetical protein Q7M_1301 [Borrelia crocidurae str. Achema]